MQERNWKCEKLELIDECSSRVMRRLPKKLNDPRSFPLPIQIGERDVGHTLFNQGAIINLIPLFILKVLGLGELRQISITLLFGAKPSWHLMESFSM